MRYLLPGLLLFGLAAYAQEPPIAPRQVDPSMLAFSLGTQTGAVMAGLEAQKATLIEWLKQAQAERDAAIAKLPKP